MLLLYLEYIAPPTATLHPLRPDSCPPLSPQPACQLLGEPELSLASCCVLRPLQLPPSRTHCFLTRGPSDRPRSLSSMRVGPGLAQSLPAPRGLGMEPAPVRSMSKEGLLFLGTHRSSSAWCTCPRSCLPPFKPSTPQWSRQAPKPRSSTWRGSWPHR